ncbi:WD40-repeat-containing domain protein [Phycomyces blakesleeanus]
MGFLYSRSAFGGLSSAIKPPSSETKKAKAKPKPKPKSTTITESTISKLARGISSNPDQIPNKPRAKKETLPKKEPKKRIPKTAVTSDSNLESDPSAVVKKPRGRPKKVPEANSTESSATAVKRAHEDDHLVPRAPKTAKAPKKVGDEKKPAKPRTLASKSKITKSEVPIETVEPDDPFLNIHVDTSLKSVLDSDYQLEYEIHGHSNVEKPYTASNKEGHSANIWACEFEPVLYGGTPSNVVALCGANYVLFLDTDQERYVKKFTHPEPTEEFYCLAWTTLRGPSEMMDPRVPEDTSCNILAVAGRLGSIKLILPLQNECYKYLSGHTKDVTRLSFSMKNRRWLFSSSYDMTVRLWDIGPPKSGVDSYMCLSKFHIPFDYDIPTSLSIDYDFSELVVGCAAGDMPIFRIEEKQLKAWKSTVDKWAKNGKQPKKTTIPLIKHKTVFPSGNEWHEGYVDDIHIIGNTGECILSELDGLIVSRGSDDREIIAWNPVTSTQEDANIIKALEWPKAGDKINLRFKVIERYDRKILIGGDYDGNIHMFDLSDGKRSQTLENGVKEQLKPAKILSDETPTGIIRDVSLSHDGKTIVAVGAANKAFVWKCKTTVGKDQL